MGAPIDQLHKILTALPGVTDDVIKGGFGLSANGYEKIGRKLGLDHDGVKLALAKLRTQLNSDGEPNTLDEDGNGEQRFSYEEGFLNDVTIRDSVTGKSVSLSSTKGSKFLTLVAHSDDPQSVMAQYMPVMENDSDHADALRKTGFWGSQGAGCLVLARSTGRILIGYRSGEVEQPHTWGTWGGAVDRGMDPKSTVLKELGEETGYRDTIEKIIPLFVFESDSFRYHNFLVVVENEFTPHLNWENDGFKWCHLGAFPRPLHFGLSAILKDHGSVEEIESILSERPLDEEEEIGTSDDSFDDEIASRSGTFNFPWKIGSKNGLGTARFGGEGDKMQIVILNATDVRGNKIEIGSLGGALVKQAKEFVSQL